MNIDYEALDTYGTLPVTPHVLILPSDLKQFIKVNLIDTPLSSPDEVNIDYEDLDTFSEGEIFLFGLSLPQLAYIFVMMQHRSP